MKPISILYVEDNADLRSTIAMLLESDDREIVTCNDAPEALAALETRPFDVVVTDVSLPGMSGVDMARQILSGDPDRWIVLCSGYDFGAAVQQLGPHVRALPKPFETEALEALIDEVAASVRKSASP